MPVYDIRLPGFPKIQKEQNKEVELLDKMNIDVGMIYENDKGELRRILRIILPDGAFCKKSEVLLRNPQGGAPLMWRTVDAAGPNCDILWLNPKNEKEKGVMSPSELKKWFGKTGKPTDSLVFPKPGHTEVVGLDHIIKNAQLAKKEYERKLNADREKEYEDDAQKKG